MPREPSTPRIAVWRKLKRLGVAQLGDGLVGLPADARTREALEWVADEVVQAGGTATVWLGRPASAAQERELAEVMAAARTAEYRAVAEQARAGRALPDADRSRLLRRLRNELHTIGRRDFFPPPERETAHTALRELTDDKPTGDPAGDPATLTRGRS
jgi:hypothetical protein